VVAVFKLGATHSATAGAPDWAATPAALPAGHRTLRLGVQHR
jgi:hypothetical protein